MEVPLNNGFFIDEKTANFPLACLEKQGPVPLALRQIFGMEKSKTIRLALVDDHLLVRLGLAKLIADHSEYKVVIQASNGQELIDHIRSGVVPDLVLLDIAMPGMNGIETATWLRKEYPGMPILILSMYESDLTLFRLMNTGVAGFLKKDAHHSELVYAIQAVMETGYYFSNQMTGKLVELIRHNEKGEMNLGRVKLTESEMAFLQLACTDLTYKEIAARIHLNTRSVDTIRDNLFEKLGVRSRVGLAMFAMRQGIVLL